jgi:hypothetical protein
MQLFLCRKLMYFFRTIFCKIDFLLFYKSNLTRIKNTIKILNFNLTTSIIKKIILINYKIP